VEELEEVVLDGIGVFEHLPRTAAVGLVEDRSVHKQQVAEAVLE
jgi:hypothetical protein